MTRLVGGIRRKLALGFSLPVLATAAFITWFFPNHLGRQSQRALIARAEAVRNMGAYSVSAALFFGDSAAVKEVVAGLSSDPEIALVEVRDTSGRRTRFARDTTDAYVSATPVLHGQMQVGTLAVGISRARLRADVAQARQLGFGIGLGVFLAGLAWIAVISTLVVKPLVGLAGAVRQIAKGDFKVRAAPTPDRDVGPLVDAVNHMVQSLECAHATLATMNSELEDRVRARTAELQTLIDLAPTAIVAVDVDWRVTTWNRAAEKMFGWTEREILGQPLPIVGEEHAHEFAARKVLLQTTGALPVTEVVRQRKDGAALSVLVSAGRLQDGRGTACGYISFITDVEERKSLEKQLRQSQKMEAVGRLAGGIAHDFNNILTVITSCAELIQESPLTTAQREDVEQISGAAHRAAALTRKLLTFSRQSVVRNEALDLNAVVHEMAPMLQRLLRENIRVTMLLEEANGSIVADRSQLEQVILNLVVNASDAMPDGGKLTIATKGVQLSEADLRHRHEARPGEYLQLTVTDSGIGMDPDIIEKIFDPFFTTKEVGKGTGLGLATVYSVVTQLRGFIDVRSAKGAGATFNIFLPMTHPPVGHNGTSTSALAKAVGRETVLLVEDDAAVRRSLQRTLERLGYSVLEASNGEVALGVVHNHHGTIDVVVTDMLMPGMNGKDFADYLHMTHPDICVVFISGYIDEATRARGLTDATHAFLQKPFNADQLGQAMRTLLDRRASATRIIAAAPSGQALGRVK